MNTSVSLGTFTVLCHHYPYLVPKYFQHFKVKPIFSTQVSAHFPLPQTLVTTNLPFVSMDLSILDISHKCNHTTCDLLCLSPFTQHILEVHLHCSIYQYFFPFFWLNNIFLKFFSLYVLLFYFIELQILNNNFETD